MGNELEFTYDQKIKMLVSHDKLLTEQTRNKHKICMSDTHDQQDNQETYKENVND